MCHILLEDFLQKSPSIIYSSMYMSFVDILVYGEFYSWHDLVVYGQVLLCVLFLGQADITSSLFWRLCKDEQHLALILISHVL